MSRTVSRVMYQMIIYLDLTLPPDSSDLPESKDGQSTFLFGLASDGVYRAMSVTSHAVVSYTAFPPLPAKAGGLFLLHFPGSHLHRTLSGILPCEARTFLTCCLSASQPQTARDKLGGQKGKSPDLQLRSPSTR